MGLAKRVIRRKNSGFEKAVKRDNMHVLSDRWCWKWERAGGGRKQVGYVRTLSTAGGSTVRCSSCLHPSHVGNTTESERNTHGYTRGLKSERDFLMYASLMKYRSLCDNISCHVNVLRLKCYRYKEDIVELFALCTSRTFSARDRGYGKRYVVAVNDTL